MSYLVDLDLTVGRTGPYNDRAGRAADAPGEPQIREHAPEGNTVNDHSRGEVFRQNADRTGKADRLRRYRS